MSVLLLQQQNIAAASGFTEYSVAIPPRTMNVTLQLRLGDTLYWYTAPSGSAAPGSAANLPAVYNTLPTRAVVVVSLLRRLGNSRHARAGAHRNKFLRRGRMDADGAVEIGFRGAHHQRDGKPLHDLRRVLA